MTRLQLASEGAYVPTPHEPTYDDDGTLPAVWTPQHVALRLIEAFRIDKRLPRVASPKNPGSAHPQMEYSDEEKAEWEHIPYDPSRAYPTPAELTTMEERFEWLYSVAETDLNAAFALRAWSICKVSEQSARKFCRQHGIGQGTFRARKDRALSIIVSMLCDELEPVF
jgi:hypothetical protein